MKEFSLLTQQRLYKMIEEIEDYAVLTLDREGNIESWNKGAEKIKGYKANEIIGSNFRIFYTESDRTNNLPSLLIEQAAVEGKAQNEGWRIRKDGTRFWANVLITAIHDDAGLVIGFTKIIRDLTFQRNNMEILRRAEDKYLKMTEEVTDYAIILLDATGDIVHWNKGAEKIKGYSSEEIVGKSFRIFYSDEDRMAKIPDNLLSEARENGRAQHEGWRVKKDGTKFWGLVSITALHDLHGHVIGFSKVTRDLTDKLHAELMQKKYIAELEKKNKELEQFAYIASHDLQEPLRTISSFSELLKINYGTNADARAHKYVNVISNAAERMRNLIKGLLEYSHIGASKTLVRVDCSQLIEQIENDLSASIDESHAFIKLHRLPIVLGYRTELYQLFQNLITNAIKYRHKTMSPQIEIRSERKAGKWIFSVQDNGIGMDPQFIHKIFLIFQRLHTRAEYQGSGIGLANCKKIAELHGGEIWVASSLGHGSTFYFSIDADLKAST